jgi:hypothetical protein
MSIDRFRYSEQDPWTWAPAQPQDVEDIIGLVFTNYGPDAKNIFAVEPVEGSRNLMHAIVNQSYAPKSEFISVCREKTTRKMLAFTWAIRDQRMPFTCEEMIVTKFASVDLKISSIRRTRLIFQIFRLWERWADVCEIKIIASCSILANWENMMYLHSCAGYLVRGSNAFKRLSMKTISLDDPIFSIDTITSKTATYDPAKYTDSHREHSVSSKEFRYE